MGKRPADRRHRYVTDSRCRSLCRRSWHCRFRRHSPRWTCIGGGTQNWYRSRVASTPGRCNRAVTWIRKRCQSCHNHTNARRRRSRYCRWCTSRNSQWSSRCSWCMAAGIRSSRKPLCCHCRDRCSIPRNWCSSRPPFRKTKCKERCPRKPPCRCCLRRNSIPKDNPRWYCTGADKLPYPACTLVHRSMPCSHRMRRSLRRGPPRLPARPRISGTAWPPLRYRSTRPPRSSCRNRPCNTGEDRWSWVRAERRRSPRVGTSISTNSRRSHWDTYRRCCRNRQDAPKQAAQW